MWIQDVIKAGHVLDGNGFLHLILISSVKRKSIAPPPPVYEDLSSQKGQLS